MWTPDTLQISKDILRAELEKRIPVGTTTALAAFLMNGAVKGETAKQVATRYNLDKEAARIAWKFLQSGTIVDTDGVILVEAASPSIDREMERELDSLPTGSLDLPVRELFRKYFPNWVEPTSEQVQSILSKSQTSNQVDDALYVMANGNSEIKNPITLLLWTLNNKSAEQVHQEREIIEKKGVSGDSIIRQAMRKAEAQIPTLPPPTATQTDVDTLRKLKEVVERGRA